jgi:hypothetical protein
VSAIAQPTAARPLPNRRQRAGVVVERALRGGVLAAAVAGIAWLVADVVFGTAFVALIVATIAVAGYTVLSSRDVSLTVWGALAIAWAAVLIERWAVNGHGGVWVGAAAFLGVVVGARKAGISKWALPLLAYPLISVAIVLLAGQDLLTPWGVSWLWVAAVLGPVFGIRVLLAPKPAPDA